MAIREHEVPCRRRERRHGVGVGRGSAEEAVRAELPDVAGLRGRRRLIDVGPLVVGVAWRDLREAVEADAVQVPAAGVELGQHVGQDRVVPLGELGRAVVGERVGAHLVVRPVGRHARNRHLSEAEVAHGHERAVAGDHLQVLADHERPPLAELLERALDGLQVAAPVLARIARIQGERADRHDLHLERRLRGLCHGQSSPRVSWMTVVSACETRVQRQARDGRASAPRRAKTLASDLAST
jgi:hypothetical protein